jgi:RNA polymerase sigma-70 factor (ECF subfamily)
VTDRLEAFTNVYDEHLWDVYGFFGYRVSSREQVEDLVQTTFERALRAWHRFDPERANARTWLLAIANNLLIDHYRRNSRRLPAGPEEPLPEADAGPAEEMDALDARLGLDPDLETALEGLSDRERELIALRYGGDLTGPEIAEITGLSLANVQQILSRALRRLHAELAQGRAASA